MLTQTAIPDSRRILQLDASMRHAGPVTRALTAKLVSRLRAAAPGAKATRRDLADGAPLIGEAWIGANFTDPAERVAAAFRAWIDPLARTRETFCYTETCYQGLHTGKRALVVVGSNGVPVGSAADFATPCVRHALALVGITNVDCIAANRLMADADSALARAGARIGQHAA